MNNGVPDGLSGCGKGCHYTAEFENTASYTEAMGRLIPEAPVRVRVAVLKLTVRGRIR